MEMEAEGFTVVPAQGGSEALALLDAGEEIDLLVTDFSMPNMDGLALIEKAHGRRRALPAILLTGYATDAVGMGNSGAFTTLRKPIRAKALAEKISLLLQRAAGKDNSR
jgi:DNA-binding NtrC family response regulator